MRVSTSQYFTQSVQAMDDQQSQVLKLSQEISSGQSLNVPSDSPIGAMQAVELSAQGVKLSQYSNNQSAALTNLQTEDTTLSSVIQSLQDVTTQLVHAGDQSLSDQDRGSIATVVSQLRDQLVGLGNTTLPTGGYLFGGFQSSAQPFTNDAAGNVVYNGDAGSPSMQISDARTISTSDPGSAVFMGVAQGAGAVSAASTANTGTGSISAVSVTNASDPTNKDSFSISFSGSGSALTYSVTDTSTGSTVASNQPYSEGASISLGGQSVTLSGQPADKDTFTITPATQPANRNIFTVLQDAVNALQMPADTPTSRAAQENSLTTALAQVGNALNNVIQVQASVGGREQEVQAMQTVNQAATTQNATALSNVASTNMVATISQFTQDQTSMQASEQAFAKIQGTSLFQYLS